MSLAYLALLTLAAAEAGGGIIPSSLSIKQWVALGSMATTGGGAVMAGMMALLWWRIKKRWIVTVTSKKECAAHRGPLEAQDVAFSKALGANTAKMEHLSAQLHELVPAITALGEQVNGHKELLDTHVSYLKADIENAKKS